MKQALTIVAICSHLACCFNGYAEEGNKPVVQEPIPPVNVDKTAGDMIPEKPGRPEIPKKIEMDTNFDGRVDRIEIYDSEGRVARLDLDTNGDGNFDEWMIFERGKPRMKGKDRNEDGRTDTWIEY